MLSISMRKFTLIAICHLTTFMFFNSLSAQSDWKDIGPPAAVTLGVYCHPTEESIIYLIADTGHLFRSLDKGDSWQRISHRVALATMPQRQYRGGEHAVAVDPRPGYGHIVYFAPGQIDAGLWKSTDYGTLWIQTLGSEYLGASVVAVDNNGVVICISGNKKIYSSTDGGDTWSDYPIPFQLDANWYKPTGYKIDVEISIDNHIWITNRFENNGIFYSDDLGQNWYQKLTDTWIVDLTCSKVDSNLILTLEQDGRIFRSEDGGENFFQTGLVNQNNYWSFSTWPPHRGGIDINRIGTVIAIGRYSMARSTDFGLSFTEIPEDDLRYSAPSWPFIDRKTTDQALKCCDISASQVDTSFWIFGDGAMLKVSDDNGLSWEGGKNIGAHGLWMYGNPYYDAVDPNVLHVACVDFGHAYTTDLGKTWISSEKERISCQGVTQDPNDPNMYYKATKKNDSSTLQIYKSTDRGHTFIQQSDLSLADDTYGGRIFVDPTNSNIIYCTIRGGKGVYQSMDGGKSFNIAYSKKNIHHSSITKSGNVFFHIWNGYGLFRYLKESEQWADIAFGKSVDGFAVHPEDENLIFFNADGILYKTENGLSENPTWENQGSYQGRQIYIDQYKPNVMLMMTEQKNIGMMKSEDCGKTWETIHQNLGTTFAWGFVPGGPAAKGRVYTFDATAYYIDDLYDPATVSIKDGKIRSHAQCCTLEAAYSNPFNTITQIPFSVDTDKDNVSVEIYNITGRKVRTLIDGRITPGNHLVSWDGKDDAGTMMANGIYFIIFQSGQNNRYGKVTLLK